MSPAPPIAIIGIGCRLPGAPSPAAFWRLLRDGGCALREVPADRRARWPSRGAAEEGKAAGGIHRGGFLGEVDGFDADFFHLPAAEAEQMDPQQRWLLEVAWEALEDAGQVRERLAGSPTAVYVGIGPGDYGRMRLARRDAIGAHTNVGNQLSIAANRLSYQFDLRGPSAALDTACSSSLVAVHLACQSLWNDEATLALAGGVNALIDPALGIGFEAAGMLSPGGCCRSFDAAADGYVRSEGVALVVLKPLERARADGDRIYALVRGSAVNQAGRTNGLTAPSGLAQEAVLRQAYRRAGVAPAEVGYVEAHSIGTLLGDAIEARALGAVMAPGRPAGRPCPIGSVKTNLGHLETAAGVASLIKAVLALRHRALPASLHFRRPNPHVDFGELGLRVVTELEPWADGGAPRLAGVSSFGFGGTNAHVVIEAWEPPSQTQGRSSSPASRISSRPWLLPLSAHRPEALRQLAGAYRRWLASPEAPPLEALCATAALRRSRLDHRLSAVASSAEQLGERLGAWLEGGEAPGVSVGRNPAWKPPAPAFLVPGGGEEWAAVRPLAEAFEVFRRALERFDGVFRRAAGRSLTAVLEDGRPSRGEREIESLVALAVQAALAALWGSWGIRPGALLGLGAGEVTAALIGETLSPEEAPAALRRQRSAEPARLREAVGELIAGRKGRPLLVVSTRPAAIRELAAVLDPAAAELLLEPAPALPCPVERQLAIAGALHARGAPLRWPQLVDPQARPVDLPAYPWQHLRFWAEP